MTSSVVDAALHARFERDIDRQILKGVRSGTRDLWDLICALPGVYPTIVRDAAERLVGRSLIPDQVLWEGSSSRMTASRDITTPSLPVPHPLDFDWRFTKNSASELLDTVVALAQPSEAIALLGTPSVYLEAIQRASSRRFFLLDRNRSVLQGLPDGFPRHSAYRYDAFTGGIDLPPFHAVLADPPWYPEDALGFLAAAASMCVEGGFVLTSFPPEGVRPGILAERDSFITEAEENGLEFLDVEPLVLNYVTPFFEHNALRAAGFVNISPNWRRGDLIVFRRKPGIVQTSRYSTNSEIPWIERDVGGVKFRILDAPDDPSLDPRLLTLVAGDILPTVSRRDPRRSGVMVWTAGNRIFGCDAPKLMGTILKAFSATNDSVEVVRRSYRKPFNETDQSCLEESVSQVLRIVDAERKEMADADYG